MATILRKGQVVETIGNLPLVGSKARDFTLTTTDLLDLNLSQFKGKFVILNIFPSIDTPTCATSVRDFNAKAAAIDGVNVICVSADLPFALNRFCGAEGIENVITASSFRSTFGNEYGLTFTTGPLTGLLSRAVVVIDKNGIVIHTEQMEDTSYLPNYDAALNSITHE